MNGADVMVEIGEVGEYFVAVLANGYVFLFVFGQHDVVGRDFVA